MKHAILLLIIMFMLVGCGTSSVKFVDGEIVELKGEAANLFMATKIEEQRTETMKAMADLEPNTQLVMGARDAINRNDPVNDLYEYKEARNRDIKGGALGLAGIVGVINLIDKVAGAPVGDTYGDVNVTQSNDPSGAFGEGGGTVSASQSPNYVMIGRNKAASGNGAVDVERFYPNNSGDNDNIQDNGKILPW